MINIKHDPQTANLIKISDVVINLAAICTAADHNTCPLDKIYSNFTDALPVRFCRDYKKLLIHFSTCEVYGKTIGSSYPKNDQALNHWDCSLHCSTRTHVYIMDC
ncbi:hypothetical protein MPTK1_1g21420 [Marchantia polymorpha subsp. ruderalis]|uniref:NAD-dependent epimerase/dehydratase domain-containing protein n=2 Tax=Marchantia polymorpha TaxID=3197 RepID=A0AAF6ASN7_MARPO|nr:hypothetical protein MARPO_0001s0477 [Marchantia polymorpha]BBM99457.1 hypothetical protein Mp_1g21420 [Marchantia polymorpha subsp. ruderalis]|eukprot:PTQ50539.1 hypothetical protein MARPO_0001s0477 [Marchantia polymorpha]